MTQQYLYLPMAEAMNDRINSLTYTEVPPIDLWIELKKDIRERYGICYNFKDLPEILSYISHWSPSPDFIINLTLNKPEL